MLPLQEVEEHLDSHVDIDSIRHTTCHGSTGLRYNHNCVHNGVQNPGHSNDAEEVNRHKQWWASQYVKKRCRQIWYDVLQVIQVGPENKCDTANADAS
jgi:hypothetical protein